MSEVTLFIGLALTTTGLGYGCYRLVLKWIPTKALRRPRQQAQHIIAEARLQQNKIRQKKEEHNKRILQRDREELQEDLNTFEDVLQQAEEILREKHSEVQREEHRLEQKQMHIEHLHAQCQSTQNHYQEHLENWKRSRHHLHRTLENQGQVQAAQLQKTYVDHVVQQKSISYQKVLKVLEAEMQASARKKANLLLSHVHARYAPEFVWPKASNVVMEAESGDVERYLEAHPHIIEELAEQSGCDVTPLTQGRNHEDTQGGQRPTALKFAGGFGIHRQAAKLTFAQLLKRKADAQHLKEYYQKHLDVLNEHARSLGKRAITDLKLHDIHPEIQYLIGALNWRTSYRQNQWLHTMEVAVLAGLIASELGLDKQEAKRCGLLHDIGKAIDYRIEGSHAIISGDYADRYGEKKIICDTVMSHHNDLLVESPLAFTLIAADTLSGARPGARVNLEEGYQNRLSGITESVRSFPGVQDLAIMNGGREVHVHVNHKVVSEDKAQQLATQIARKIEQDVSYPAQIKIQVSRTFESQSVA